MYWESQIVDRYPIWYKYGKIAADMLDKSCKRSLAGSTAQIRGDIFAPGQIIWLDLAFSDAFFPLGNEVTGHPPSSIMPDDPHERRKIFGMNGLSPQLMHYLSRITFIANVNVANPTLGQLSLGELDHVLNKLKSLRQWSKDSDGYTIEEIRAVKDEDICLTKVLVVDLIALCYVEAIIIYLHTRGLRYAACSNLEIGS
jgi:hypothetical protein